MVWDLGKAMRKKEEFESARLMDFDFRQRARATRLLARSCKLDEASLVQQVAVHDEAALIAVVSKDAGISEDAVWSEYQRCLAIARRALIEERGDPTPHRLG